MTEHVRSNGYRISVRVHTVDGGNLTPLLQRRFLTAPYPLFLTLALNASRNNDRNFAPPQTEQLSVLKRGCPDASLRHRRSLLYRFCKISSIHRLDVITRRKHIDAGVCDTCCSSDKRVLFD